MKLIMIITCAQSKSDCSVCNMEETTPLLRDSLMADWLETAGPARDFVDFFLSKRKYTLSA